MTNMILGVNVEKLSRKDILEKIEKYISQPGDFIHIVSLNPENVVIASEVSEFKRVLTAAQIKIIDGIGIVMAARIKGIEVSRVTGVSLMEELLGLAGKLRLRVLFIGGGPNLALRLAQCYQLAYPEAKYRGTEGFKNIIKSTEYEKKALFSIVSAFKPHIVFVSFGSPDQELWLWENRERFKGSVCMGVGGAFDFLAGKIVRAPSILRTLGFEWLFRLIIQPWRWKRQLRLLKFSWMVLSS